MTERAEPVPERLRVALVFRHFNHEGSLPSIFYDRAVALSRGADVTAVCSAATREPTDAPVRFETVEPVVRGSGRLTFALERATFAVRAARRLARLRDRFHVVHSIATSTLRADLVTVPGVRPADIKHYFEAIEPDARLRRLLAGVLRPEGQVVTSIERRLFRPPYPYCLAETRAVAAALEAYYGVPRDAIEVLGPGVDRRRFRFDPELRSAVRGRLGTPAERLVVLFVGDDFERKGLDRSIAALARAGGDAELWVAGGGGAERYGRLAAQLGLAERVRFLGRVEPQRIHELYSGCDVVLLPSRLDVWGHSVVEGLAAGRVVIASEYTGAHEAIEDGVSGFVVARAGSAEQIATVLERVADRAVRERMRPAAERAAGPYDADELDERFRASHRKAYDRRLRFGGA